MSIISRKFDKQGLGYTQLEISKPWRPSEQEPVRDTITGFSHLPIPNDDEENPKSEFNLALNTANETEDQYFGQKWERLKSRAPRGDSPTKRAELLEFIKRSKDDRYDVTKLRDRIVTKY